MNVLGLKIKGHDTGAALIAGKRVIAIAEERLSRVKHSVEAFPHLSIKYCLETFGIKPDEIDLIVLEQVSARWRTPIKEMFLAEVGNTFSKARVELVNHQDAHAASAFFCSPFDEAAVLVYDGAGEIYQTHLGVTAIETDTLYRGVGNKLHKIQKTLHLRDGKMCPYTQGIGKLYSDITAYVNMGKYNEGKTMGLAPYGNDSILKQFPPEMWFTEREGHIICNSRISFPKENIATRTTRQMKGFATFIDSARSYVRMSLKKVIRPRIFNWLQKFYSKDMFVEPNIFPVIKLPRPPRKSSDALPDEYYSSVAYAVQKVLEMVALRLGTKLKNITGSEYLCVAGGVGLNIDANIKFITDVGFKHIFVQPGASDTGIPLGCALHGMHEILNQPRFYVMKNAELGRPYTESEIKTALKKYETQITVKKSKNIVEESAKILADQKIIGWFYGGSEYGPRSLGRRSILCDARPKDMRDIVNNRVKHREPWRPFAASVLKEDMTTWFETTEESPFMLLAPNVVKDKRDRIPSVVHVDGTSRIQTVTKEADGRYYDLINAFKKITDVPLILDTSFNLAGEPIVETPEDAIKCFLSTNMDYLVLENYLISKK